MSKQIIPKKTLKDLVPDLAKEWDTKKNSLKPNEVSPQSHKRIWWKCEEGHSWEEYVYNRYRGNNCPFCSGKRPTKTNNFKVANPQIAKYWDYKKNKDKPEDNLPSTSAKRWFKCKENHSFETVLNTLSTNYKRSKKFSIGCPYCANQKIGYGNDLKSNFPKIAKEWDYEKNKKKPNEVFSGTDKKYWWKCKEGHSWEASPTNRTSLGRNCPYCSNQKASPTNNLKFLSPKIAKEWDYEKNNDKPEDVVNGAYQFRWWICKEGHSYKSVISSRTGPRKRGCPFCSNRFVSPTNNLKYKYPKIAKEFDIKKNKTTPEQVIAGSNKKFWFKCKEGHSWNATPNHRIVGKGCPYCANHLVSPTNNLKYKYPKIAKEFDIKKNKTTPEQVIAGSNKKFWFKCKEGHSWNASLNSRTYNNNNCPYCANQLVSPTNNLKYKYPELAKQFLTKENKITPDKVIAGSNTVYWWKCQVGHKWKNSPHFRKNRGCPYCTLTPRSREEVYLLFELKQFFNIDENNHKIKLKRVEDVDIKLANEKVVIEYDGAYWHKDKAERDKAKTKALEKAGWTVIRVREKPLKVLSRKYNVSSKTGEYKETANKVLNKLNQLGYEVKGLDKYLERKTLVNKKEAEKYIDKLLKKKNKK